MRASVEKKQENVSASDKTHERTRYAIRTPELVDLLPNMISEDPEKSIRSLLWDLEVDE